MLLKQSKVNTNSLLPVSWTNNNQKKNIFKRFNTADNLFSFGLDGCGFTKLTDSDQKKQNK